MDPYVIVLQTQDPGPEMGKKVETITVGSFSTVFILPKYVERKKI